jgi:hypothetical protein
MDEAEQYVLCAYEAVVEQARFFLCQHKHPASPISKPFEHSAPPPSTVQSWTGVYRPEHSFRYQRATLGAC